ncbi:tol-pal system YbgF family protein [Lacinutrix iliipiscaria]|uniref:Tol-pal system YbgF family protein n=1 Tax=Lacinutrix iliipiscaria TaxID=1230532 RepID=A0ABW5WQC8_9FLAO
MRKISIFLEKILDYILRRKTLISVLFILSSLLVRELTAYSAGDSISSYSDEMISSHQDGFWYYFFSTVKAIFNSGSIEVIIITTFLIIIISLLKFLEIKGKKIGSIHFGLIILFSLGLITFLLSIHFEPLTNNKRIFLLDPLISMDNIKSDAGLVRDADLLFYYSENLQKSVDLDTTIYHKIINFYEDDNIEECKELITEAFDLDELPLNGLDEVTLDEDEQVGYVVASHFALKQYDKAAQMVLKRNLNYKVWDQSLKLDLAKCIRYYSLQNGFIKGFDLVDSLLNKFPKNNIISKLWTVIPYEYLVDIELGKYNSRMRSELDQITYNNIEFILSNNPNEPFCGYGNYILGNFDDAISCNENVRIEDIIIYSMGYSLLDDFISRLEQQLESDEIPFFFSEWYEYISENTVTDEGLEKALSYFEKYVDIYKGAYHYNDSLFWIAWIQVQKHNFDKALSFLNRMECSEESGENSNRVLALKSLIYDYLSQDEIVTDVNNAYRKCNSHKLEKFVYLESVFENLDYESQISMAKSGQIDISFLFDRLGLAYRNEKPEIFFMWYELLKSISKSEYELEWLSLYTCEYEALKIDYENLSYQSYIDNLNRLCKDSSDFFHIKYLEIGLEHYKETIAQEKMIYLIIRKLVNFNPTRVEEFLKIAKEKIPNSTLLDDIYAETVFAFYISIENEEKGELILNEMINEFKHKENNALDNALYWVVLYYMKKGYLESWSINKSAREKFKKYKKLFFELYPNSTEDFSKEDAFDAFRYL